MNYVILTSILSYITKVFYTLCYLYRLLESYPHVVDNVDKSVNNLFYYSIFRQLFTEFLFFVFLQLLYFIFYNYVYQIVSFYYFFVAFSLRFLLFYFCIISILLLIIYCHFQLHNLVTQLKSYLLFFENKIIFSFLAL